MPYRFAAKTSGPLAQIAGGLALPAALTLSASEDHHLWAFTDPAAPSGQKDAWAILPTSTAVPANYTPRFDSVDDWLPGMTALFERRLNVNASASAEVSALWTSLAAPLRSSITGDIGLDLDLGIQTNANWQATSDCWWSIQRPDANPALRVRLCAARANARTLKVTATAHAGLDQATRNALAAFAGKHRGQLLSRLNAPVGQVQEFLNHWLSLPAPTQAEQWRNPADPILVGIKDTIESLVATGLDQATRDTLELLAGKQGAQLLTQLNAPIGQVQSFLNHWLTLPLSTQAEQWRNAADPLLASIKYAAESLVATGLGQADQLTARLEFAAVRTLERRLEASLTALFDKTQTTRSLLDATFDFAIGGPGLQSLLDTTRTGNLVPLLNAPINGVTLHDCAVTTDLTRRHTFAWRVPFASGAVTDSERLQTAMQCLDDATGRVVKAFAKAEAERRTRGAASLLSIEGAFASHIGGEFTVHDPASLHARFEMVIKTNRPRSLEPLLRLYDAGPADPKATMCRMVMTMPPESMAHWLLPQDPCDVSRRIQTAWRALLPAAIDLDELAAQAAAPLLVWAALPVSTAVRRTNKGVELNRTESTYWDWLDSNLREAMVWNPRTRTALEALLAQSHLDMGVDDARRIVSRQVGGTIFRSLLYTEASFVGRLTAIIDRYAKTEYTPVEALRNLSYLLGGLTNEFHKRLTSVYGSDAARALGPLLLTSASGQKPTVEVTWSR